METATGTFSEYFFSLLPSDLGEAWAMTESFRPLLYVLAGLWVLNIVVKVFRKLNPTLVDAQRLYTKKQRMEGFARAGNQCEEVVFFWFRCSTKAEHGDHHYPHSRGGATTMENFVAMCAKHNRMKSDKVPSAWATRRLQKRREDYFPENVPLTTGEWLKKQKKVSA